VTTKRGRPPGSRQADRKRNLFVYLLVAHFMDIGLSREDAVDVAAGLLARDQTAFDNRFVRRVHGSTLAPRTRLWKEGQPRVRAEAGDGSVELPLGALVWLAWEQAWRQRADYGIPEDGLFLSSASIRRIYDDLVRDFAPADSVTCPECGHKNISSPARGESFVLGDICRKCGNGTGWIPSDS